MEVVIPQSPGIWGGYFKFLDVAKQSALAYGNTVSVLEPFPCAAVDEFRKHYVHNSPNPDWFEKWCFEQWLLLADWMEQNNKEVVFKIDSDCLVFYDLQRIWESIGKPAFTRPVPSCFITKSGARSYSDYILERFLDSAELKEHPPSPHLSDLYLVESFVEQQQGAFDIAHYNYKNPVTDTNLFDSQDGHPQEKHKDIWFVQGQPCWIRPNGYVPLLTIHCWGNAKHKMDLIWQQSRQSIGGPPVRLSFQL